MLLILHIAAAIGSLVAAGTTYFSPSTFRIKITNALTASMFISGTVLVVQHTSHLLEACVMGLVLLSVVVFATSSARQKLAQQ